MKKKFVYTLKATALVAVAFNVGSHKMISVTEIEGVDKKGASQYGESPFSGEKEDSFIGAYITNNHIYIVRLH